MYALLQVKDEGRFQSTPPRRRRHRLDNEGYYDLIISIHASTQEATSASGELCLLTCNFNPRLHAGGDSTASVLCFGTAYFNPRLHAGGDDEYVDDFEHFEISIHASTQEATDATHDVREVTLFQSTPPRRRRPRLCLMYFVTENFNPRLHAGGDRGRSGRIA